jgi:hypothetical protein
MGRHSFRKKTRMVEQIFCSTCGKYKNKDDLVTCPKCGRLKCDQDFKWNQYGQCPNCDEAEDRAAKRHLFVGSSDPWAAAGIYECKYCMQDKRHADKECKGHY